MVGVRFVHSATPPFASVRSLVRLPSFASFCLVGSFAGRPGVSFLLGSAFARYCLSLVRVSASFVQPLVQLACSLASVCSLGFVFSIRLRGWGGRVGAFRPQLRARALVLGVAELLPAAGPAAEP